MQLGSLQISYNLKVSAAPAGTFTLNLLASCKNVFQTRLCVLNRAPFAFCSSSSRKMSEARGNSLQG
jgi:hypothetical protein